MPAGILTSSVFCFLTLPWPWQAVHGSGRLYAKRLTAEGFVYVAGALRRLATEGRPMTADEGRQYGQLYGVCCRCGAQLTDEESIARGMGPVCASKF